MPAYDCQTPSIRRDKFKAISISGITPEFQDDKGYDKDEPGQANLTVGSQLGWKATLNV